MRIYRTINRIFVTVAMMFAISLVWAGPSSIYVNDELVFKKTSYSKSPWAFNSWRDTGGEQLFLFDPSQLGFALYDENGRLVGVGKAVGGAHYCSDVGRPCRTVRGEFSVYRKGSQYCRSSAYPRPSGGAPMPYCMHFYRGYAIHGSNDLPSYNASHGCIRIAPKVAKWLSEHFINVGTKVIVLDYK